MNRYVFIDLILAGGGSKNNIATLNFKKHGECYG